MNQWDDNQSPEFQQRLAQEHQELDRLQSELPDQGSEPYSEESASFVPTEPPHTESRYDSMLWMRDLKDGVAGLPADQPRTGYASTDGGRIDGTR